MKKYIFVGVGSFIGAILRYILANVQVFNYHGNLPLNTLAINIAGTFILAFILDLAYETFRVSHDMRTMIAVGILGAFTTFSTMCKEIVLLINTGEYLTAATYAGISALLGLASAYFGTMLAAGLSAKITGESILSFEAVENTADIQTEESEII